MSLQGRTGDSDGIGQLFTGIGQRLASFELFGLGGSIVGGQRHQGQDTGQHGMGQLHFDTGQPDPSFGHLAGIGFACKHFFQGLASLAALAFAVDGIGLEGGLIDQGSSLLESEQISLERMLFNQFFQQGDGGIEIARIAQFANQGQIPIEKGIARGGRLLGRGRGWK